MTSQQISEFVSVFPSAKQDEPMSLHANMRIGGPADLYVVAETADALVEAVEVAKRLEIPFYVFGGGSNLLVADEGFRGLMIQAADRRLLIEGDAVTLGAGCITALAARKAAEASFAGFEWAIGVPGTIGGATYGNAGCYGGEMKDVVDSVEVYRLADGLRTAYSNQECRFGYRESRFKHEPHLILSTRLRLQKGDRETSLARIQEIINLRKEKQPLDKSSAGCLFKNFEFEDEKEVEILARHVDIPESMMKAKRVSAAWLVDQAGLKGMRVGNIEVSTKHANFLVNLGGGRAQDVVALSSLVKTKIRDQFGIILHDEVQMVGF